MAAAQHLRPRCLARNDAIDGWFRGPSSRCIDQSARFGRNGYSYSSGKPSAECYRMECVRGELQVVIDGVRIRVHRGRMSGWTKTTLVRAWHLPILVCGQALPKSCSGSGVYAWLFLLCSAACSMPVIVLSYHVLTVRIHRLTPTVDASQISVSCPARRWDRVHRKQRCAALAAPRWARCAASRTAAARATACAAPASATPATSATFASSPSAGRMRSASNLAPARCAPAFFLRSTIQLAIKHARTRHARGRIQSECRANFRALPQ